MKSEEGHEEPEQSGGVMTLTPAQVRRKVLAYGVLLLLLGDLGAMILAVALLAGVEFLAWRWRLKH
jgi:hypothetical protein